jgi:hypothetical protein
MESTPAAINTLAAVVYAANGAEESFGVYRAVGVLEVLCCGLATRTPGGFFVVRSRLRIRDSGEALANLLLNEAFGVRR